MTCFGGAGGQHACAVASVLGINTILVHPFAGILSAYGMGLADVKSTRQKTIEAVLDVYSYTAIAKHFESLSNDVSAELIAQGIDEDGVRTQKNVHLKYEGSDSPIEVPFSTIESMQQRFGVLHLDQFGL